MIRSPSRQRHYGSLIGISLLLGLTACAVRTDHSKWAAVKPVQTQGTLQPNDAYYESAVTAINKRDYARALDLLQIARAYKADDVRVLNAFGVVYDELGRFDLSARYYAQARAIDQSSTIVANNMAHSTKMQELLVASQSPAPASPLQPYVRPVFAPAPAAQPAVIRIAAAPPPVMMLSEQAAPVSLVLVNAAGPNDKIKVVRLGLAELGWSISGSLPADAAPSATTKIVYAPGQDGEARKLAQALPDKPKMVACDRTCAGLRLIVGMDSAEWVFTDHFAPRHSDGNYATFRRTLRPRLG